MSGFGESNIKFRGVRRRKWGKWVSEIRVPGTQDRLWLGTYATPEAAAVAHDVAFVCLRETTAADKLNFPTLTLPAGVGPGMSPASVQTAASNAGMAVDAQLRLNNLPPDAGNQRGGENNTWGGGAAEEVVSWSQEGSGNSGQAQPLSVSVEDYWHIT
ncbi:unnamed protein product [Cuscuta epithymum]|uniref:AP2/ERF domain-containing protein n=1 Tax=Cuscuta epithymum TaxID=186058 RepID=A0AAV0CF08_9ASTE|nr:unnamed protein product [Cuscuta epithymum]